tara:strand:- start:99 stop:986 length:888 start_codon:yes stop_codon:yes gene_type:complete
MDLHTMQASSSFVHLRQESVDPRNRASHEEMLHLPEHKILDKMMREVPECINIIQYCTDRLTQRLSNSAKSAQISPAFLREAITYLLVYGLVPFTMPSKDKPGTTTARHDADDTAAKDDSTDNQIKEESTGKLARDAPGEPRQEDTSHTVLSPEILNACDVLWESGMFDIACGERLPRVQSQISPRRTGQQPYIYFYRPSYAASSVISMFRKILPAYRALLVVREYNVMVRKKNATRTLIVNRGLPPPEPAPSYDETNKADLFDTSILQTATRISHDQVKLHIETDIKQVCFAFL